MGECAATETQQAQGTHPWAAVHTLTYMLEGGPLPAGPRRPSIVATPAPLRPAVATGGLLADTAHGGWATRG